MTEDTYRTPAVIPSAKAHEFAYCPWCKWNSMESYCSTPIHNPEGGTRVRTGLNVNGVCATYELNWSTRQVRRFGYRLPIYIEEKSK